MQWIRRNLSFANVTSLMALFVVLGGTAFAAVTLPKNSVKAKQIATNAVGASEIKSSAVRTGEVLNGSLQASDFAAGQLPAGAKGDKGDKGDSGNPGTFGVFSTQFEQATAAVADGDSLTFDAFCPDGQRGVAGGARGDATDSEFTMVTSSRPAISPANTGAPVDGGTFTGWRATVLNPTGGGAPPGGDILPEVWVVCVIAAP